MFLTMYANALFSIYLLGFLFLPDWQRELGRSRRMLFGRSSTSTKRHNDGGYSGDDEDAEEGEPLIRKQRRPKVIPLSLNAPTRERPARQGIPVHRPGLVDEMDPISENKSFRASVIQASLVSAAVVPEQQMGIAALSESAKFAPVGEEDEVFEDYRGDILAPHQVTFSSDVFLVPSPHLWSFQAGSATFPGAVAAWGVYAV